MLIMKVKRVNASVSNESLQQTSAPALKSVSLRWPESLWEAVTIAATRKRTTLQALITEAVCEKLGIPIEESEPDAAG